MRSRRGNIFKLTKQNWWLWGSAAVALVLTGVVIEVPAIAALFEFTTISFKEYLISMGLALAMVPLIEVIKACQRVYNKGKVID